MLDEGDLYIIRVLLSQWLDEHSDDPNVFQVREVLEKVDSADRRPGSPSPEEPI